MIAEPDSVEMAIQEWFYLHPWGYWIYWILGFVLVIWIIKLPEVERDGHKLIVRLPHTLSGSVETKQGLNSKSKEKFK